MRPNRTEFIRKIPSHIKIRNKKKKKRVMSDFDLTNMNFSPG